LRSLPFCRRASVTLYRRWLKRRSLGCLKSFSVSSWTFRRIGLWGVLSRTWSDCISHYLIFNNSFKFPRLKFCPVNTLFLRRKYELYAYNFISEKSKRCRFIVFSHFPEKLAWMSYRVHRVFLSIICLYIYEPLSFLHFLYYWFYVATMQDFLCVLQNHASSSSCFRLIFCSYDKKQVFCCQHSHF